MRRFLPFLILASLAFNFFSCSKKTEEYQSAPLSDYYPLAVGKYITYRVDSTVFTNFGQSIQTHSYQVKHAIEALVTDNLGRPAYRVFTYIRDTAGTQPWTPNGSYYITPLGQSIEVIADNFRIIKLHLPVKKDYSWKGNGYLPDDPYAPLFGAAWNGDYDIATWEFAYTSVDAPLTINGNSFSKVTTVTQVDERNIPDTLFASNNQLIIPNGTHAVWARGGGTDTIIIIPPSPSSVENIFSVANRTNQVLKLNGIPIPIGYNRAYQYRNSQWTYPFDPSVSPDPDSSVTFGADYSSLNYGVEKFAVNLGLVYRELIMWEFQPTYVGDNGVRTGFGIKMSIIDHN